MSDLQSPECLSSLHTLYSMTLTPIGQWHAFRHVMRGVIWVEFVGTSSFKLHPIPLSKRNWPWRCMRAISPLCISMSIQMFKNSIIMGHKILLFFLLQVVVLCRTCCPCLTMWPLSFPLWSQGTRENTTTSWPSPVYPVDTQLYSCYNYCRVSGWILYNFF